MASAAVMMIGGAVVNAFAFSGSNYLFSQFGGSGDIARERKRHDLAMEKFQRAQAEWSNKRNERIDILNEKIMKEQHAVKEFDDADQAMRLYYNVTELPPEPKLSDYYTPSKDQEDREKAFVVGGMLLTSFIAWKLL